MKKFISNKLEEAGDEIMAAASYKIRRNEQ